MNAKRFLKSIPLLLLSTALSAPVVAASGGLVQLEYIHAPIDSDDGKLHVLLDQNGDWNQIQNEEISWRMIIDATWNTLEAPPAVVYWIQKGEIGGTHGDMVAWQGVPQNVPIAKIVNVPHAKVFPLQGVGPGPAELCNARRDELVQQGQPLRHALSNDQIIHREARSKVTLRDPDEEIYESLGSEYIEVPLTIVCQGNPQIAEALDPHPTGAVDSVALPFQVTGAFLSVLPGGKVASACPVELSFIGKIHTAGTGPATVKYRLEWPTGERSTVFSKQVDDPSMGVDVFHKIPIPLPPAIASRGGSGGGGGAAAAGGGGFVQTRQNPPPPGPLPETNPPPAQGPAVTGATLPANEHKNDVRLVVVSHADVRSNVASYHIVCDPKVTKGVAGPAGITIPGRNDGAGDPARPHVLGTVPNPRSPAVKDAPATAQPPTTEQTRESELQFVQQPARRSDRPSTAPTRVDESERLQTR